MGVINNICDIPLLNGKFCDFIAGSQHMLGLHACSWIFGAFPFCPERPSDFSISSELEDSVVPVVQKASRGEDEVSVNPLQEIC